MAIKSVSALVLDGLAIFEFGVICEVFGIDRSADGVPNFDFKVCGPEAGKPLRTSVGATIIPDHGLDELVGADLVAIPAIGGDGVPARGAGGREGRSRFGIDHPHGVLRRVRRGRGRTAGRSPVHHALDARRRAGSAVSDRGGRPQRAVRRRRQPDHQRGHRGGHRRLPAPGAPRDWAARSPTRSRAGWWCRRSATAVSGSTSTSRSRSDVRSASRRIWTGFWPTWTSRTPSPRWLPARTCRRAPSRVGSWRRRDARRCSGSPISACSYARTLLEETDLDVDRIAERSGFGTATLLRHHFRRIIGVTPSDYRRRFACGGSPCDEEAATA